MYSPEAEAAAAAAAALAQQVTAAMVRKGLARRAEPSLPVQAGSDGPLAREQERVLE